jgi:hypothetical protein
MPAVAASNKPTLPAFDGWFESVGTGAEEAGTTAVEWMELPFDPPGEDQSSQKDDFMDASGEEEAPAMSCWDSADKIVQHARRGVGASLRKLELSAGQQSVLGKVNRENGYPHLQE